MHRILTLALISLVAGLLSGCAGTVGADPAPRQCGPQEHLVCTGKKATKLDVPADRPEFCRCEPNF